MQAIMLPRPEAHHQDLRDYHVPQNTEIHFDEYGRPYEKTPNGKVMLNRKNR